VHAGYNISRPELTANSGTVARLAM